MKKIFCLLCLMLSLLIQPLVSANQELVKMAQELGYPVTEDIAPKASLLMDATSGQIIWSENIDLEWNPASISKLMTIYLIYEAMEAGEFDETTTIMATEEDEAVSQIYALSNNTIIAGGEYPIGDLISASLVQSSNVAILMLSNYLAPERPADFIDLMNAKAEELGMTETVFYNSGGAEASSYEGYYDTSPYDLDALNQMSARDAGILAYHLIKDYPQVLKHTRQYAPTIMSGTEYEEELHSSNLSLPGGEFFFQGVDGLKTGSSPESAYNAVFTAQRDGQRYIAVVFGVSDWDNPDGAEERHYFLNGLFNYGFNNYQTYELLEAGRHKIGDAYYEIDQPLSILRAKDSEDELPKIVAEDDQLVVEGLEMTQGKLAVPAKKLKNPISKLEAISEIADREQEFNWPKFILTRLAIIVFILWFVCL